MVLLLFCNVHIKIRNKQNNLVSKKKVERIVQSKAGFVDFFFLLRNAINTERKQTNKVSIHLKVDTCQLNKL